MGVEIVENMVFKGVEEPRITGLYKTNGSGGNDVIRCDMHMGRTE